jgi:SAM-dependent methyltransferase
MKNERYILDRDDEEARHRFGLLERISDPATIDYLLRIEVGAGWNCLEIGAGGGSIAAWLCRRVGPGGRVVATDTDTRFLKELRFDNLEVLEQNLDKYDPEGDAFDLVHARNVLVHIPEREATLRKLAAAIKPGGWILVEDPDVGAFASDPAAAQESQELFTKVTAAIFSFLEASGLDPRFGARLFGLLQSLGFEQVGSEGRLHSFRGGPGETQSPHILAFEQLREQVVSAGELTGSEFGDFLELVDNPSFSWREGLTMAAWGRRPPESKGWMR